MKIKIIKTPDNIYINFNAAKWHHAMGGSLPGYANGKDDIFNTNDPWDNSFTNNYGVNSMNYLQNNPMIGPPTMNNPYPSYTAKPLTASTFATKSALNSTVINRPDVLSQKYAMDNNLVKENIDPNTLPKESQYAMIGQGIGQLAQAGILATQKPQYQKFKPLQNVKFDRVNPNAALQNAKEQYTTAQNNIRKNAGNIGEYLANTSALSIDAMGKTAAIKQSYDAQNAQIQMQEAQSNAQIAMQNAEMKLKVGEINAQEYDAIRGQWMQYLNGLNYTLAGMNKDVMAYKGQNKYIDMLGQQGDYSINKDLNNAKVSFKNSMGGKLNIRRSK